MQVLGSFQITSGFVQGVNQLDFVVTNDDCGPSCVNPVGLRVKYRVAEVPEPATLTYVIFGLPVFMLFRRDFRRSISLQLARRGTSRSAAFF
jgi:hypothetical protein